MKVFESTNVQQAAIRLLTATLVIAGIGGAGRADDSQNEPINCDALKHVAVYHQGRVKPFDTFARLTMGKITGRENKSGITLNLEAYVDGNVEEELPDSEYAPALTLFPDGEDRKFEAVELVLSWLVEPDKWEVVPFLYAPHEDLRELVGVQIENDRSERLKYVSPAQIARSESLLEYFRRLEDEQRAAQSKGEEIERSEEEKRVFELLERYTLYRAVTLEPEAPLTNTMVRLRGSRTMFIRAMHRVIRLLDTPDSKGRTFESLLEILASAPSGENAIGQRAHETRQAIQALGQIGSRLVEQRRKVAEGVALEDIAYDEVPFNDVVQAVTFFRQATAGLESEIREQMNDIYANPELKNLRTVFKKLASDSKQLNRLALQMHVALYDEGDYTSPTPKSNLCSLLVVPAIDTPALAKDRDTAEDRENKLQPWLSLQAVLHATEEVGDNVMFPASQYPADRLTVVRDAWDQLAAAYQDRSNKDREQLCVEAQQRLASALRELGESIEKTRRRVAKETLAKNEFDEDILAYTQYPTEKQISTEVLYNSLAPFNKSWLICLLGAFCFLLAFGKARPAMFWLATGLMVAGILWTAYGFYLRVMITQWAPVTTMWETVVFVPFVVAVLGTWFLLLPVTWPGLRDAWRLNANPLIWEAKPLTDGQLGKLPEQAWVVAGWALTIVRVGLMAAILYVLSIRTGYADGGRPIISLEPSGLTTNGILVWGMSMICLLLSMWVLPRVALTLVASLVFIPWNCFEAGRGKKLLADTYNRKWFGFAAAFVAFFFYCLASFVQLDGFDRNFSPLQPVLRSNFWLTIHVMTIVASYGAGMLAWGLGLIGLTYCLFGRYRKPVVSRDLGKGLKPARDDAAPRALRVRPPEECTTLANYAYRAVQVAVLLLAAGTILGGLWADVSWGRFWGWDPKEVWALISLLVYLVILHGRFAGWFNNFGMLAGTVFGYTAIAFSWYGVNFILPQLADGGSVGLHSYGTGSGGMWYVIGFGTLNLIYLGVASARYLITTRHKVSPEVKEAETAVPAEAVN